MRHRILGLEAVLPDGSVYSDLSRVLKNAAGYDLKHLFIGGEGTLGIITRVAIRLEPKPQATATILFGLPSVNSALEIVQLGRTVRYGQLRAAEAVWSSFFTLTSEHHHWSTTDYRCDHPIHLLLSLGGAEYATLQAELEDIYEETITTFPNASAVLASTGAQERNIWRLREDTDLIYRKYPGAPSFDISVPLSEVSTYLDRCLAELKDIDATLDPYVFGHLADGNLHIVLNAAARNIAAAKMPVIEDVVYRNLRSLGGSFSAEHGIGTKRVGPLLGLTDPAKHALMQKVKDVLDPTALFNPGKILA